MALQLKQSVKMSQQLAMTPQLQQAIKLLQLNRVELAEMITQELTDNPILLEEGLEDEPIELSPEEKENSEESESSIDWEEYIQEFENTHQSSLSVKDLPEDLPHYENTISVTTSLEDHLRWQMHLTTLAEPEKKFCELVIGNLDDNGYLIQEVEKLARESKLELEDALEVLKIIQCFDPIGVAARNLQECLLIQAQFLKPRQPHVELLIEKYLDLIEKKKFKELLIESKLSQEEFDAAIKIITQFEPKPGRAFHTSDTQYITPDIYILKIGNEYVVSLNEEGIPKLKISNYYRNLISKASKESKETQSYIQEKLKSALWLIKSIHNRQKTIFKVTEAILRKQRDFFEFGPTHLKPMILKTIADDIGMHESTVSRVTTNKFVHTPLGTFELKYFFNASIASSDGSDAHSSESVKLKIKQLIQTENPKKPYSDQKIAHLLQTQKIDIARRTVAKYREALGIAPSSQRKKT